MTLLTLNENASLTRLREFPQDAATADMSGVGSDLFPAPENGIQTLGEGYGRRGDITVVEWPGETPGHQS